MMAEGIRGGRLSPPYSFLLMIIVAAKIFLSKIRDIREGRRRRQRDARIGRWEGETKGRKVEVSAKRWPSRGLARLACNKHKSSEAYLAAARRTPKIKYHTFRPLRPPFTHPPVHPSFHALADNAANKISLPPPRNYNKHIKSTKYIYIYRNVSLLDLLLQRI